MRVFLTRLLLAAAGMMDGVMARWTEMEVGVLAMVNCTEIKADATGSEGRRRWQKQPISAVPARNSTVPFKTPGGLLIPSQQQPRT